MMRKQRGELRLGRRTRPVRAELELSRGSLAVSAYGQTWAWPVSAVGAQLWDGSQFELTIAGESVIFASDDPLSFVFEFLPVLEAAQSEAAQPPRWWQRLRREPPTDQPRPAPPLSDVDGAAATSAALPSTAAELEPTPMAWTDVVLGSAHNEVMRLLERKPRAAPHTHRWEDSPSICSDCRQVLIDLTQLGAEPETA